MGNDLRQRLEALNAEADEAKNQGMFVSSSILVSEYLGDLDRAFRSGELVTRSEMEEAVAKAVEEEREAIAKLHDKELEALVEENGSYDPSTGQTEFPEWVEDRLEWHEDYAAKVRARSEQKERE